MSKRIILFVILFCLIFAVVPVNMGVTEGGQYFARAGSKGLAVHDPIYINCNSNFTSANGVSNPDAAGTDSDPYIIENWDINASTANGIKIENTNVYFIIRDCAIYDGKSNHNYGIYFRNVTNSKIQNCVIHNNYYGVCLSSSSNNSLTDNQIHNNSYGIWLSYSSNNNIISTNQICNNNYYGISLGSSSNNEIHYNNIYNNTDYGVYNYNIDPVCQVNATYNWWGSADGPDGVGLGEGDNITNNVLYDPCLQNPVETIENNPPTLSNGTVSPPSGDLDTVFKFVITYTDEDNNTPAYVNVIIDGSPYNMTKQNINDSDYKDGCIYEYSTNLSEGFHSYSFEASDKVNATVYPPPPISPIYGLKVTEKEEQKTEAPQIIYYIILIVVIIVVEVVVGIIFLIKRKKTMILKCPKCGTIFKVERKKEVFKVECPTCGAEGTIKPVPEKKTLPEKIVPETPTRTLRCPKCRETFTVEEKTKPFSVKCPHCGNEGTIR